MATQSSILAWRILWTKDPGWLQFMESQSDMTECLIHTHTHTHTHTHSPMNSKEKKQEQTARAFGQECRSDTCELGGVGKKRLRLSLSFHTGTLAQRLPTEWSLLGGNGPALTHCLVTLCLPQPTLGWMEKEGTLEDISQLHSSRQHDQSSLEGALSGGSLHLPQTQTVNSGGEGGHDIGDILDGQEREGWHREKRVQAGANKRSVTGTGSSHLD